MTNFDAMRDRIEYWLITSGRMEKILARREANAELYRTVPAHWLTVPVAQQVEAVTG